MLPTDIGWVKEKKPSTFFQLVNSVTEVLAGAIG